MLSGVALTVNTLRESVVFSFRLLHIQPASHVRAHPSDTFPSVSRVVVRVALGIVNHSSIRFARPLRLLLSNSFSINFPRPLATHSATHSSTGRDFAASFVWPGQPRDY